MINDPALYRQASAGVMAFQENMEALKHNFLLRGFFKQRGYEDAGELAKHRISRLPPGLCRLEARATMLPHLRRDGCASARASAHWSDLSAR